MSSGYSGTPLVKKLGIKAGWRICVLNSPQGYALNLENLADGITVHTEPWPGMEFVQTFCTTVKQLDTELKLLPELLATAGMLWISWPKKSSGVASDLSGNIVRQMGLATGLVDVKVCAIDEVWSGLKFVIRLEDRREIK